MKIYTTFKQNNTFKHELRQKFQLQNSFTPLLKILFYLYLTLLALSLSACSSSRDEQTANNSGNGNDVVGKAAYEEFCADCHGVNGEGIDDFTKLNQVREQIDIETIIEAYMPISDPDICTDTCAQEVAQYIFENFTGEPEPVFQPTGESLYITGCSMCHGENGEGNSNLPAPDLTRDLSLADLTTIIQERMPILLPEACVDNCANLTAQYIFDNFAIPTDSPPQAPPIVSEGSTFYTELCASCHGVDGLGVGATIGVTQDLSVNELTTIIQDTMPELDPTECVDNCAIKTAEYIFDNFRIPVINNPFPVTGEDEYVSMCAICHGLDGRGVGDTVGFNQNYTLPDLTIIIADTMPPEDTVLCIGDCATNVAQYIFDNLINIGNGIPPSDGDDDDDD